MTPERVLVTGAGGFLGSALVRALAAAGREVHGLTRRERGPADCAWHRADLADADTLKAVVDEVRPEAVFHLAAAGVAANAAGGRVAGVRANVLGTANLFDALDGVDYRAFVHAGTGAEYGPTDEALAENAPLMPVTDYAAAKAAAALLCLAEARRGRPVAVVRIFGAYGPGEAPNRLLPYVLGCCRRGEAARVSSGVQVRDWVYVDDVVNLLVRAADPALAGRVLHAATGRGHAVREAVETAVEVAGGPPAVFGAAAPRAGEPTRYLGAIETTTRLTGWTPRVGLRDGIHRTWEWVRARPAQGS